MELRVKLVNRKKQGAVQVPLVIGLLLMGLAVPAAVRLVQQSQETRREAGISGPCKQCVANKCEEVANPPHCDPDYNECGTNVDCYSCTPGTYRCVQDRYWQRCLGGNWVQHKVCDYQCASTGPNCKDAPTNTPQPTKPPGGGSDNYRCTRSGTCVKDRNGNFDSRSECENNCGISCRYPCRDNCRSNEVEANSGSCNSGQKCCKPAPCIEEGHNCEDRSNCCGNLSCVEVRGTKVCIQACDEGDRKCAGAYLQECQNGQWINFKRCDQGCDASTSQCNLACYPGQQACDGDVLKTCASDGSGWREQSCSYGCNPVLSVCNPKPSPTNTPKPTATPTPSCKSEGSGCSQGQCCSGLKCAPAYGGYFCLEPRCEEEEKQCAGVFLQQCDQGQWINVKRCENGCDASTNQCKLACDPGEKECDGDILKTCASDGSGWREQSCSYGCDQNSLSCKPKPKPTSTPTPTSKPDDDKKIGLIPAVDTPKPSPTVTPKPKLSPTPVSTKIVTQPTQSTREITTTPPVSAQIPGSFTSFANRAQCISACKSMKKTRDGGEVSGQYNPDKSEAGVQGCECACKKGHWENGYSVCVGQQENQLIGQCRAKGEDYVLKDCVQEKCTNGQWVRIQSRCTANGRSYQVSGRQTGQVCSHNGATRNCSGAGGVEFVSDQDQPAVKLPDGAKCSPDGTYAISTESVNLPGMIQTKKVNTKKCPSGTVCQQDESGAYCIKKENIFGNAQTFSLDQGYSCVSNAVVKSSRGPQGVIERCDWNEKCQEYGGYASCVKVSNQTELNQAGVYNYTSYRCQDDKIVDQSSGRVIKDCSDIGDYGGVCVQSGGLGEKSVYCVESLIGSWNCTDPQGKQGETKRVEKQTPNGTVVYNKVCQCDDKGICNWHTWEELTQAQSGCGKHQPGDVYLDSRGCVRCLGEDQEQVLYSKTDISTSQANPRESNIPSACMGLISSRETATCNGIKPGTVGCQSAKCVSCQLWADNQTHTEAIGPYDKLASKCPSECAQVGKETGTSQGKFCCDNNTVCTSGAMGGAPTRLETCSLGCRQGECIQGCWYQGEKYHVGKSLPGPYGCGFRKCQADGTWTTKLASNCEEKVERRQREAQDAAAYFDYVAQKQTALQRAAQQEFGKAYDQLTESQQASLWDMSDGKMGQYLGGDTMSDEIKQLLANGEGSSLEGIEGLNALRPGQSDVLEPGNPEYDAMMNACLNENKDFVNGLDNFVLKQASPAVKNYVNKSKAVIKRKITKNECGQVMEFFRYNMTGQAADADGVVFGDSVSVPSWVPFIGDKTMSNKRIDQAMATFFAGMAGTKIGDQNSSYFQYYQGLEAIDKCNQTASELGMSWSLSHSDNPSKWSQDQRDCVAAVAAGQKAKIEKYGGATNLSVFGQGGVLDTVVGPRRDKDAWLGVRFGQESLRAAAAQEQLLNASLVVATMGASGFIQGGQAGLTAANAADDLVRGSNWATKLVTGSWTETGVLSVIDYSIADFIGDGLLASAYTPKRAVGTVAQNEQLSQISSQVENNLVLDSIAQEIAQQAQAQTGGITSKYWWGNFARNSVMAVAMGSSLNIKNMGRDAIKSAATDFMARAIDGSRGARQIIAADSVGISLSTLFTRGDDLISGVSRQVLDDGVAIGMSKNLEIHIPKTEGEVGVKVLSPGEDSIIRIQDLGGDNVRLIMGSQAVDMPKESLAYMKIVDPQEVRGFMDVFDQNTDNLKKLAQENVSKQFENVDSLVKSQMAGAELASARVVTSETGEIDFAEERGLSERLAGGIRKLFGGGEADIEPKVDTTSKVKTGSETGADIDQPQVGRSSVDEIVYQSGDEFLPAGSADVVRVFNPETGKFEIDTQVGRQKLRNVDPIIDRLEAGEFGEGTVIKVGDKIGRLTKDGLEELDVSKKFDSPGWLYSAEDADFEDALVKRPLMTPDHAETAIKDLDNSDDLIGRRFIVGKGNDVEYTWTGEELVKADELARVKIEPEPKIDTDTGEVARGQPDGGGEEVSSEEEEIGLLERVRRFLGGDSEEEAKIADAGQEDQPEVKLPETKEADGGEIDDSEVKAPETDQGGEPEVAPKVEPDEVETDGKVDQGKQPAPQVEQPKTDIEVDPGEQAGRGGVFVDINDYLDGVDKGIEDRVSRVRKGVGEFIDDIENRFGGQTEIEEPKLVEAPKTEVHMPKVEDVESNEVQTRHSIGRSSDTDVVFSDGAVSRQHAEIIVHEGGKVYIKDLNSTNGTYVNGEKLLPGQELRLEKDDLIDFGLTRKRFEGFSTKSGKPLFTDVDTAKHLGEIDLKNVSDSEAQDIMNRAEIHGSNEYNGRYLTLTHLSEQGLEPAYVVDHSGAKYWISKPYDVSGGRAGVVVYVETPGGGVTARSYYRSNSQGVWRYVGHWEYNSQGGTWWGKGWQEEAVTIPFAVQRELAKITAENNLIKIRGQDPEFILLGTTRKGEQVGTVFMEQDPRPENLDGNFYQGDEWNRAAPETLTFNNLQDKPDFNSLVDSWKQDTSMYGEITMEVYPSKNGVYRYLFCSDTQGRAWIGGIETNDRVWSTGVRETWVDGGQLTTPAYEYYSTNPRYDQTGGYANLANRKYDYADMYENYLSRIPVIKEYQAIKNSRVNINTSYDEQENVFQRIFGGEEGFLRLGRKSEPKPLDSLEFSGPKGNPDSDVLRLSGDQLDDLKLRLEIDGQTKEVLIASRGELVSDWVSDPQIALRNKLNDLGFDSGKVEIVSNGQVAKELDIKTVDDLSSRFKPEVEQPKKRGIIERMRNLFSREAEIETIKKDQLNQEFEQPVLKETKLEVDGEKMVIRSYSDFDQSVLDKEIGITYIEATQDLVDRGFWIVDADGNSRKIEVVGEMIKIDLAENNYSPKTKLKIGGIEYRVRRDRWGNLLMGKDQSIEVDEKSERIINKIVELWESAVEGDEELDKFMRKNVDQTVADEVTRAVDYLKAHPELEDESYYLSELTLWDFPKFETKSELKAYLRKKRVSVDFLDTDAGKKMVEVLEKIQANQDLNLEDRTFLDAMVLAKRAVEGNNRIAGFSVTEFNQRFIVANLIENYFAKELTPAGTFANQQEYFNGFKNLMKQQGLEVPDWFTAYRGDEFLFYPAINSTIANAGGNYFFSVRPDNVDEMAATLIHERVHNLKEHASSLSGIYEEGFRSDEVYTEAMALLIKYQGDVEAILSSSEVDKTSYSEGVRQLLDILKEINNHSSDQLKGAKLMFKGLTELAGGRAENRFQLVRDYYDSHHLGNGQEFSEVMAAFDDSRGGIIRFYGEDSASPKQRNINRILDNYSIEEAKKNGFWGEEEALQKQWQQIKEDPIMILSAAKKDNYKGELYKRIMADPKARGELEKIIESNYQDYVQAIIAYQEDIKTRGLKGGGIELKEGAQKIRNIFRGNKVNVQEQEIQPEQRMLHILKDTPVREPIMAVPEAKEYVFVVAGNRFDAKTGQRLISHPDEFELSLRQVEQEGLISNLQVRSGDDFDDNQPRLLNVFEFDQNGQRKVVKLYDKAFSGSEVYDYKGDSVGIPQEECGLVYEDAFSMQYRNSRYVRDVLRKNVGQAKKSHILGSEFTPNQASSISNAAELKENILNNYGFDDPADIKLIRDTTDPDKFFWRIDYEPTGEQLDLSDMAQISGLTARQRVNYFFSQLRSDPVLAVKTAYQDIYNQWSNRSLPLVDIESDVPETSIELENVRESFYEVAKRRGVDLDLVNKQAEKSYDYIIKNQGRIDRFTSGEVKEAVNLLALSDNPVYSQSKKESIGTIKNLLVYDQVQRSILSQDVSSAIELSNQAMNQLNEMARENGYKGRDIFNANDTIDSWYFLPRGETTVAAYSAQVDAKNFNVKLLMEERDDLPFIASTVLHENIHQQANKGENILRKNIPDGEIQSRIEEGLTLWAQTIGSGRAKLTIPDEFASENYVSYLDSVRWGLLGELRDLGVDNDEVSLLVLKAAAGDYEPLVKALGQGDKDLGWQKFKQAFETQNNSSLEIKLKLSQQDFCGFDFYNFKPNNRVLAVS
jgi:hypothetical protein